MDHKSATLLVIDNGLFVELAIKLSQYFKRVLYWTPWVSAFPASNSLLMGDGLEEIERIKYLWDHVREADIVVCPDVYFGDIQEKLVQDGKLVWGARRGDDIELGRWEFKRWLDQNKLPNAKSALVTGLERLRDYLREHEDVWVKVSTVRGDFETFHSPNYKLIEPRLDELEWRLGPKKFIEEFIVEANIPNAVEVGYDGWCIDGKYPEIAMFGYEIKDEGLMGTVKPYAEMPQAILDTNDALSPLLKGYNYRGFLSTELRVTEMGEPYLIDPCTRAGSPPSELYQELFSNWGEIIWEGAQGRLVKPEAVCQYGCEIMIHSTWADKNWLAVEFPDEIRQWVKLRNLTRIGGHYYVVPQSVGLPEVGAVIGIGNTLVEAVQMAKDHAAQIEGYYIDVKTASLVEGLDIVKEGEAMGMHFTDDKLPTLKQITSCSIQNSDT